VIDLLGLEPWAGLAGANLEAADVVVAGIPYDGSAVYRRGAAQAPAVLRRLSAALPPVTEDGISLRGLRVHDLGDLDAGAAMEAGWKAVADRLAAVPPASLLTVLGGDHCVAAAVLAAQAGRHPGLRVLWLDAHPDLCDFSRGGRWTCGCALRRALEVAGLEPGALLFAGGRDYDPEEVDFIARHRLLMVSSRELSADPVAAAVRLAAEAGSSPLHVSFDIDVLDPAYAPGTEIPSAGGISTRQALDLLAELGRRCRLVGLDVTEVAPPFDHGDITSLAALKILFEFWGLWKRSLGDR